MDNELIKQWLTYAEFYERITDLDYCFSFLIFFPILYIFLGIKLINIRCLFRVKKIISACSKRETFSV